MKKILATFLLSILGFSALHCELPELQKIDCHVLPMDLTSKGNNRSRRYTPSKIKKQWSHPIRKTLSLKTSASINWAGYAAVTNLSGPATKAVTYVTGTWTVPTVTTSSKTTYSSAWVGIDGYSSSTVQQIGTEHDWQNGKQVNYAWFEMYPNYAYLISGFPVNKGDAIRGEVRYTSTDQFQLTLTNITRNVYTIIPSRYTKLKNAARSSAEWVMEAPSSSKGVLPLAHFGKIAFKNCWTTIKGISGSIHNAHWQNDRIIMVTNNGAAKATPSALSTDGTGFTATWSHE